MLVIKMIDLVNQVSKIKTDIDNMFNDIEDPKLKNSIANEIIKYLVEV